MISYVWLVALEVAKDVLKITLINLFLCCCNFTINAKFPIPGYRRTYHSGGLLSAHWGFWERCRACIASPMFIIRCSKSFMNSALSQYIFHSWCDSIMGIWSRWALLISFPAVPGCSVPCGLNVSWIVPSVRGCCLTEVMFFSGKQAEKH